jgi:hypothetical protein
VQLSFSVCSKSTLTALRTLRLALFTAVLILLCFRNALSLCCHCAVRLHKQLSSGLTDGHLAIKQTAFRHNQSVLLLLVSMVTCRSVLTLQRGVKHRVH